MKLKPEWSAAFIAGTLPYKPRPYLKARMPGFPARAEGLAVGLSLEHGYPAASPPDPAPDPTHLPDAKALTKNTGLNCVSCHKVGDVAAVGVFEAPGLNFMHVKERLRKGLLRPLGPIPAPGGSRHQDAQLLQRRGQRPAHHPRRPRRPAGRGPLELPPPRPRHRVARGLMPWYHG